jgi:hypothetical protein
MKRTNTQSFDRKVKRGHVRINVSEFIKNPDGTPKVIIERRSTRGRWLSA